MKRTEEARQRAGVGNGIQGGIIVAGCELVLIDVIADAGDSEDIARFFGVGFELFSQAADENSYILLFGVVIAAPDL